MVMIYIYIYIQPQNSRVHIRNPKKGARSLNQVPTLLKNPVWDQSESGLLEMVHLTRRLLTEVCNLLVCGPLGFISSSV